MLDHDPGPPVRRTLRAAPARRFVALINGLPVWPPGTYNCPMGSGARDHLLFHAPRSSVAVTVSATGCGTVEIGSGASYLRGGAEVDRLLRSLLGLR